jgi:hypothetical protein
VIRLFHFPNWRTRLDWRDDRAAQLVEFAVSLPLLVVFVVGIFDFSGAFTLKQKLTNAARDSARAAAAEPANDLIQPVNPLPASVSNAYQVADNYLIANKVNDCGIAFNGARVGLTWTFIPPNPCPVGVQSLIINRAYYFPETGAALPTVNCASQAPNGQIVVIGTCVSIQYAYPWKFGRVASLIGATSTTPTTITAVSVSLNEN